MTAHHPTRYEIETASGRFIDLLDPNPDSILLADVAAGLANTCRYGGQLRGRFYSVAEHASLCCEKLIDLGRPDLALAGLHHDDAEAYLGDIPRPLKLLFNELTGELDDGPVWTMLERRMDDAIVLALAGDTDLAWTAKQLHDPVVRQVDEWALRVEARQLMHNRGALWAGSADFPLGPERPLGLPPLQAADLWLGWHHRLVNEAQDGSREGAA